MLLIQILIIHQILISVTACAVKVDLGINIEGSIFVQTLRLA